VSRGEVTRLIQAAGGSDRVAAEQLFTLVYDELKGLAEQRMRGERAGNTLQATALVHETYLRLVGEAEVHWQGRRHFFAAAAEAMRRILIDRARRKRRVRHGGELQRVDLEAVDPAASVEDDHLSTAASGVHRPSVAPMLKAPTMVPRSMRNTWIQLRWFTTPQSPLGLTATSLACPAAAAVPSAPSNLWFFRHHTGGSSVLSSRRMST
jgi:RNA polymerase sigma factor (TIGR02999 family)